jgi:hypothetical protein
MIVRLTHLKIVNILKLQLTHLETLARSSPHLNPTPKTCFIIIQLSEWLIVKTAKRALVIKSLFFVGFHSPYIFGLTLIYSDFRYLYVCYLVAS